MALGFAVAARAVTISGLSCVVKIDANGAWLSVTVDASTGPRSVLIAAGGGGLAALGHTGTVSDAQIEVWDGTGTLIASNDDRPAEFANDPSYPILERTTKDAGLRITLTEGVYAIRVSGVGGTAGTVAIDLVDLGNSPGLVSLSLLARTLNREAVIGATLVGDGNINLTALATGPNLPVATPLANPRLAILAGQATVTTQDTTVYAVAYASRYSSPAYQDGRNAGFSFLWSVGPLVTPNVPPAFSVRSQDGGDGAFLFELHNNDAPILRRPTILGPPMSTTVNSGDTLILRAVRGGELAATIQWQRDGVDIPFATGAT